MSIGEILVTVAAIRGYLEKARKAQQKLKEATKKMDTAAKKLISVSGGEWADAFAKEQKTLVSYSDKLFSIGDDYCKTVEIAANKYEQAEEAVRKAIQSNK